MASFIGGDIGIIWQGASFHANGFFGMGFHPDEIGF
jgi:hypothetical protein